MIEIEQKCIERFYFDPVMAAHVIMGARLDTFQKARLRFFWFTPETIDSSGVGTGKTIVDFVYLNLRCILIPNHLAAIYFPNFQVGKDAFWNKYFPAFEELSPIFRAQFAQANKREEEKANQRNPGAWIRSYKNGSKLFMPAPDFKRGLEEPGQPGLQHGRHRRLTTHPLWSHYGSDTRYVLTFLPFLR
jgi:hypothetical protein